MARVAVSNRQSVVKYFNFTGASPSISTQLSNLTISGDLDMAVLFQRSDTSQIGTLMARANGIGTVYSFHWGIDASGGMRMTYRWSTNGTNTGIVAAKTVAAASLPLVSNIPIWFRVTHDVDNGASGNDVRFYWAKYNGTTAVPTTWTQMGATQNTAGTTAIVNVSQPFSTGTSAAGAPAISAGARIYRSYVRDGIDGSMLFDFDASRIGFITSSIFLEPSNIRVGLMSGGVSRAISRPTASGRVSAV
jgi:hypothetical protein